jgi:diguanylate cyclase (GGDEF)-like protein
MLLASEGSVALFHVEVFAFAAGIVALLLAAGLLVAYAINRRMTAFGWWAASFVLLAISLVTSTLRLETPAVWIKWVSWTSFYAAASLVAYGLHRQGATRGSPLARIAVGAVLLVAVVTTLTVMKAPPHYWLLLGPIPTVFFMAWSAILVFRAGAWGYGLTILAGIAAIAIRSLLHPGGLPRAFSPPPPALRGGLDAGGDPGAAAIALDPRPPMRGLIDFSPPPGPIPPVEYPLTITLVMIAALLALAVALVLRDLLAELDRMRERSTIDGMTGLLNRATFEEAATALLAEGNARPACMLLFDIDHFKRINDTAGHAAGDQVIARLGHLLRENILLRYTAGRVGGEEFAVILANSDIGTARHFAEAIRAGFSASDFGDDIGWGVTLSAGIAIHQDAEGLHSLTARADKALYAAKAAGRDRVTIAQGPAEGHWQGAGIGLAATA